MRRSDLDLDPRFERIARIAALALKSPVAAVLIVRGETIHIRGHVGLEGDSFARAGTLADGMVRLGEARVSTDIRTDERFAAWRDASSWVRFYACAPLRTAEGDVIGLVAVADREPHPDAGEAELAAVTDLADLAMTEVLRGMEAAKAAVETAEALREHQLDHQRLELAVVAGGMAEFEWSVGSDALLISERLSNLLGLPAGRLKGVASGAFDRHVHPDERPLLRETFEAAVREGHDVDAFYRWIRPDDGRERWHSARGVFMPGDWGEPPRLVGVIQDVTERKLADDARETLLQQMDHRVRNLLASVQSLVNQTARRTTSLDAFLKMFGSRLKAMASAHDLLAATRWAGAAMADVAAAAMGGLAAGQTRWDGPDLTLTPRAANALSLALNELAANALKFGALSVDEGRVEVIWRRTPDGGFAVEWLETGGPAAVRPARRGFGLTLLEDVTSRDLGGPVTIDYRRSGLHAELRAGPAALAADAPDASAPVEQEPEPEAAAPTPSRGVTGLRVLIVEDSLLLSLELEQGLTDAGAEVVGCAAEVEDAMAMLDRGFDAAVLDANLNGQAVTPVAQALAARGTPFVFATGYADKAAPMGFDAPIVRKPYNVRQIERALAEVTGRAS
jgi:PAS domain S-box-containing protein